MESSVVAVDRTKKIWTGGDKIIVIGNKIVVKEGSAPFINRDGSGIGRGVVSPKDGDDWGIERGVLLPIGGGNWGIKREGTLPISGGDLKIERKTVLLINGGCLEVDKRI